MVSVPRSVTISTVPSVLDETWAGSASALLSSRVDAGIAVSFPSARRNPLMLGVPLLSTYTSAPLTATLAGLLPPEPARSASRRPSG